jgi:hypothetical protein
MPFDICMDTIINVKILFRPLLICILSIIISFPDIGQTVSLPENSDGKVEYCNSIETDSIGYFYLWNNAERFLSTLSIPGKLKKEARANENLTELSHQFGFYLFSKPALTRQIDGVIIADINIKVLDTKYEYRINNFKYIKYARDRFGRFVPKNSKRYPLERYYLDNKEKKWKTHISEIDSKMINMTGKLEKEMIELHITD